MRLTATFTVTLAAPIVMRGGSEPRTFETQLDGFDVSVTLVPVEGARSKRAPERLWTRMVQKLSVSVTRDESSSPPEIGATAGGGRDFTSRASYLRVRLIDYSRVARRVLNNVLSFVRFDLHQPLVGGLDEASVELANPVWSDEHRHSIDARAHIFIVRVARGERSEFGVVKFERKHEKAFRAALTKPRSPRLHEEILADAQAAAFEGNFRRSVLELAIACEVFVKHTFLGTVGTAAQVYETLEDKGRLNVRILDLIEIGGTARLGKGFRDVDRDAYTDIDHLFRARNKIAHRGEAVFRDDDGRLHTVDLKIISKWWRSAHRLFEWAG